MVNDKLRGHPIILIDNGWFYKDTMESTVGNERPCGNCGKDRTEEGHDACLGTLNGFMNACCGHGEVDEAYVQYLDKSVISGQEALAKMNKK